MAELPLQGVRVLDLSAIIAAPTAARHLADFGADVIKVERPGAGDPVRAFDFFSDGVSLWWKNISRNKRPITIDLKHPEGRVLALRLAEHADVLIENFRPGTLERLGLGVDVLHGVNPGLVILRVTGYGQDGPNASRPGFGTLAEAFSGYAALTGYPDRPPLLPPIALADEITGLVGALGIMYALYHRDVHGGTGQVVDAALYESLFAMLGPLVTLWDQNREMQPRRGSRIGYTAPRNTYETSEGHFVALAGSSQSIAQRIFEAIGRPELFDDPRFCDNTARMANLAELDEVIAEWMRRHRSAEIIARFDECEAAVSPVHDMESVFEDPHYAARGTIASIPDDELGTVRMQNVVPRLSATPGRIRHGGLPMGSCTDEILREAGMGDEEIARLHDEGAV